MIVVVGSRHDNVAQSLVDALPGAALCSAEDLTRPGWAWPVASPEGRRWVVDGRVVEDREVTGVLVRRSGVYPEELLGTHPDDREYLAAEATAFLVFVLSRTGARVANPVADGALGDEAIRPERWMPLAAGLGIEPVSLRVKRGQAPLIPAAATVVEVVARDAIGGASPRLRKASVALADELGLLYASFVFDGKGRLLAVSAARPPGAKALDALASLLGRRGEA